MSRLLVDTHTLLWSLGDVAALSPRARESLADPGNDALVSTASLWEIAIKRSVGKLTASDELPTSVVEAGFTWLPVSPAHAWDVGALPLHHRDPFDRLLIAQARAEHLTIVTADRRFGDYEVEILW